MWAGVEADLAQLLSSQIFKALLHERDQYGDVPYLRKCLKDKKEIANKGALPKMYPGFLFKAAILPEFPTNIDQLIPVQRERLKEAARLEARLLMSDLSPRGAVREQRASVEAISGRRLFRAWDSRWPRSETGVWWFSEAIWGAVSELPPAKRKDALRNLLAVSHDWSNMDRVSFLTLESQAVSAIVAKGLPQGYYSKTRWNDLVDGSVPNVGDLRKDYFKNLGAVLEGGAMQFYLPWTPQYLVTTHGSL